MIHAIYNPECFEQMLYNFWEKNDCFKPNFHHLNNSYCIVLPPPNITGGLHIGHAFQYTIIDILIRYQRMQGKNTLWQMGTDHAGIATQMIVERSIFHQTGKNRFDYDRNSFIDEIWKWKEQSQNIITHQMKKLGNSIDWSRERFTMDHKFSHAVKKVFIQLYRENLIYRSQRLVNWDFKLCTVISDLEVDIRESKGSMWYIRYALDNNIKTYEGLDYLVIATTRPETIPGDTAIAVNPKDIRYQNLIGHYAIVPLIGRKIPIIGDEYVDIMQETGCIKVTPAHDFNDYEISKRHMLPIVNIFTLDGKIRNTAEIFTRNMNLHPESYKIPENLRGVKRFDARKIIVTECIRLKLLITVKSHNLLIPFSNRSNEIIEPMLTNQWYVRIEPLAKLAIDAVNTGKIQFIPKKYENMYFSWMNNIKDWCISRQLWWGHRIPVWYDNEGAIYVGYDEHDIRKYYKLQEDTILFQDTDVLDTWFSSGLWSFASLGWPKNTKELNIFHPTNVIISGFDIIFFWIARMIMLTMHIMKDNNIPQIPFKTVYITGLICDQSNKKMSKSTGNVIDPLDIIHGISLEKLIQKQTFHLKSLNLINEFKQKTIKQFPNGIKPYGADVLRFSLANLASSSRNITWDINRLEGYRNFCNKLWNASRFVLMHTKNQNINFDKNKILTLIDRWIITKLQKTIKIFREALDTYRFDLATNILYEFIWNQFCDWYIELSKLVINKHLDTELQGTLHTLIHTLEILLRLSHPIIPFITEIIWREVKTIIGNIGETIMLQSFPIYDETLIDISAYEDIEWVKKVIVAIRSIRSINNISSNQPLSIFLSRATEIAIRRINENMRFILSMTHVKNIFFISDQEKKSMIFIQYIDEMELWILENNLINKESEFKSLTKQEIRIQNKINQINLKLNNSNFINFAPKDIIIQERKKLKCYQQSIQYILEKKEKIQNS